MQDARAGRLTKRARTVGALIVFVALVGFGFSNGFGTDSSPEPVVQAFLIDWQQGHYTDAAELTNGDRNTVSSALQDEFHQLNATAMFFLMRSVRQHGQTAVATFQATVDLAGSRHSWVYNGRFGLVSSGDRWLVDWKPSVMQPSLAAGDRLTALTSYSQRGQVTDASGKPLIPQSTVYYVGVIPGRLSNAAATATTFGKVTGLNAAAVLGTINSAPPHQFRSLLTLDPGGYSRLRPSLARIKGLVVRSGLARLFNDSNSFNEVGTVGTENAATLVTEGTPYQPGETIGQSGLEAAYQDTLAGSPDIVVAVVNAQGVERTLWTSEGVPGQPVRTTISGKVQAAANASLESLQTSGEIVAVNAKTGHILALAGHNGSSLPLPSGGLLDARISPGATFSIVSGAALLASGLRSSSPLPCQNAATVGGRTFTYSPEPSSSATLASDFAAGCGTAFATASQRLSGQSLARTAKGFGVGASWDLPVRASAGTISTASGDAELASQATGGGVATSPLGMAMVAAEVDSGTGRSPVLLPGDSSKTWAPPISQGQLSSLRAMMRSAVRTGPAHAADLSGTPVYGQAGVVATGTDSWLSWFVGYRGSTAFAVLQTSQNHPSATSRDAAWQLAASFLSAVG